MTAMRSVQTKGFPALIPVYEECQKSLDLALKDRPLLTKIRNLPETIVKNGRKKKCLIGDHYKMIHPDTKKYAPANVPNPSWYLRMIEYSLLCIKDSLKEKTQVFDCLKEFNFNPKAVGLREKLESLNLYPSNSTLDNMARSKVRPDFPEHAVFRMDYACSDRQMCTFDSDNLILRVMTTPKKQAKEPGIDAWTEFKIILPSYIREQAQGKICKPLFFMDKNERFVCQIAYECVCESHPNFQNILGVDLGKVKAYSAAVLYKDKTCSDEFVPSKELDKLQNKLDRIQEQIDSDYAKIQRCKAYRSTDKNCLKRQQARLEDYSSARMKRTRVKEKAGWLIAEEIVQLAVDYECKEIHIENLNWIHNEGGKWDYSLVQQRIKEAAELKGIAVVKVSCKNSSKTHPKTKEIGTVSGRQIVFEDGTRVDRDQLAGLNLALRSKKGESKTADLVNRKTVKTRRSRSRRRANKNKKQSVYQTAGITFKNKRRTNQIALFSSKQANTLALTAIKSDECYDGCITDWNVLPAGYLGAHIRHRQSVYNNIRH